jgi:ribosomal protein L3 glutamine methyltransferase
MIPSMEEALETPAGSDCESLQTVVDFVRWGASRFAAAGLHFGHGVDNAVDESLHLVTHVLHLDLPMPPEFFSARLTARERLDVSALIERRLAERRPAAYLTGEAWFAGLSFSVDERVLVPRSPIAELIETGFAPWIETSRIHRVLDLCTGSGCIGIACAHYLPQTSVDLTDVSEEALEIARRNIANHGLEERVHAFRADVYDGLEEGCYDIIVSNPPYVSHGEYAGLPQEYHHEPAVGLVADDKGLAVVRRILADASSRLQPGGILIVEVGNSRPQMIEEFPDLPLTWLDFSRGGSGVFLLTREDLADAELSVE